MSLCVYEEIIFEINVNGAHFLWPEMHFYCQNDWFPVMNLNIGLFVMINGEQNHFMHSIWFVITASIVS